MSWNYRYHRNANYGKKDERLSNYPTRVTWLTFDQWLTFYHGDPEHWQDFENSNYRSGARMYHIPVYRKINKYGDDYIYIKFLTRSDFKKYKKYIKTITKKGEDFENLHEIEELAKHIGKIADERLRETQKRTQQAIDENERLMKEARLRLQKEIQKDQEGRWMWK